MSTRRNNFDLVRLFAACQVMVMHVYHHLAPQPTYHVLDRVVLPILSFFPGVPIFFGLSGYLITQSFWRNPSLKPYTRNRALRIFPALWICYAFTVLMLAACGFVAVASLASPSFWAWVVAQVSFFQFYTPDFLRGFGLGNPNGSLWTITVELQFYLIVPAFYLLTRGRRQAFWWLTTAVSVAGLVLDALIDRGTETTAVKLYHVTVLPYLAFFWVGVTLSIYGEKLLPLIKGKALLWLAVYLGFALPLGYWVEYYSISYFPDPFSRLGMVLLMTAVFAFALSNSSLSDRLLRGVDVSYGIYLYHAPLLGLALHLGLAHSYPVMVLICGATVALALVSWFVVEKPSLSRKAPPAVRVG